MRSLCIYEMHITVSVWKYRMSNRSPFTANMSA